MKEYTRIRQLREDNDLTQKQMGEILNIPQRTYSYYENAGRMLPPEIIIKIAIYHKTSTDYLLELTDNPKPYPRTNKK